MKRVKLRDDPMVKAIRLHGFSTVMRAITFAAAWAIAAESLGHEPTIGEYQHWWAAKERVTFKDQAAFRKVTGLKSPAEIYRAAKSRGVELDKEVGAEATGLLMLPYMRWAV